MTKYSNEQLHEAYSIEYHAHRETQNRFNQETRAHAFTRRALMEALDELEEAKLLYIVEAASRFYKEIGITPLDSATAYDYFKKIRGVEGVFTCVEIGKGFIVGHITQSFLQPHIKMCTEAAWFVEKEYRGTTVGIRLLKNYEKKARKKGAKQISMVSIGKLNAQSLDKIYTKMGYEPFEQHYIKEI